MKALFYIKNNSKKVLFICFIVLVLASFIAMLFPGYNEFDGAIFVKAVPIGFMFYLIGAFLNGQIVLYNELAGTCLYTQSEAIVSGIAILIFFLLFIASMIALIIYAIKRNKLLPFSPVFIIALLARVPLIVYISKEQAAFFDISSFVQDIVLGVIAIIAVLIDLARLGLWLYHKHAPRPPRPHKPTNKERIAELEKRISELEGKE